MAIVLCRTLIAPVYLSTIRWWKWNMIAEMRRFSVVPSLAQIAIATPPVRTVFGRYLIECNYDYDHDLLLHLPERKGVARVVPRRCLFFGFSFFFSLVLPRGWQLTIVLPSCHLRLRQFRLNRIRPATVPSFEFRVAIPLAKDNTRLSPPYLLRNPIKKSDTRQAKCKIQKHPVENKGSTKRQPNPPNPIKWLFFSQLATLFKWAQNSQSCVIFPGLGVGLSKIRHKSSGNGQFREIGGRN